MTKSSARPNSRCVGLFDELDDAYLSLPADCSVLPAHSTLVGQTSHLQRLNSDGLSDVRPVLLHNVSPGKHNECLEVSDDDMFEMTMASSDGGTSVASYSSWLFEKSGSQELPDMSSIGCVTQAGSLLFQSTVAQPPLSSFSVVQSVTGPCVSESVSIASEFNSDVLDFSTGVVRRIQNDSSSVGLRLLGDEILQQSDAVQPGRNIRASGGIVIREPEYPLHRRWQGLHTPAAAISKGKGKTKIDYGSPVDVRSACKRSFMDINSSTLDGAVSPTHVPVSCEAQQHVPPYDVYRKPFTSRAHTASPRPFVPNTTTRMEVSPTHVPVSCEAQQHVPPYDAYRKPTTRRARTANPRPFVPNTYTRTEDCIGYIRTLGKVQQTGDATTSRTLRMKVELQNLNGHSVPLTLWNELATNFPMQTYLQLQQPVVLAASSCYAKRYAATGALQLSSTPATHVYLNPNVPETEHILTVYNELLGTVPLLEYHLQPDDTTKSQTANNKVDLQTLLSINPETHKGVRFTVEATLTRIDTTGTWYFNKCSVCGKGLDAKYPHWQCHQHGTQLTPDYRYCFKVIIEDSSGTITASCFSPETDNWVISCVDLLNEVEDTNPRIIPQKLRLLENTDRLFTIHFGSRSNKNFPKFIVDNAPLLPPLALPAPPINTQIEKPSTVMSPAIQPTCASEISQELTTPPPITPEAPDKPHTPTEKHQSTVKRELFVPATSETATDNTKKPKTK